MESGMGKALHSQGFSHAGFFQCFAQILRDTSWPSDGENAVIAPQTIKREPIARISFLEFDFHQGFHLHFSIVIMVFSMLLALLALFAPEMHMPQ